MSPPERNPRTPAERWTLIEAALAAAVAAALIRVQLEWGGWPARLSPAVWVYLPLLFLLAGRRRLAGHGFGFKEWTRGWRWLGTSIIAVLLPFAAATLLWRWLSGSGSGFSIAIPGLEEALWQLALVAIPEELFFRGYLQGRLRSWARARGLEGPAAPVILAASLFALAHVLVEPRWWRAAVFFPGLVMGWLRERSGGLAAPAGFHWLANLAWAALGPQGR